MKNQKGLFAQAGFIVPVLIIFSLIVLGTVAYFYSPKSISFTLPTNSPKASILPTSISDPTENWKVYVDSQKGFQLQHPPTWNGLENQCYSIQVHKFTDTDLSLSEFIKTQSNFSSVTNVDGMIKEAEGRNNIEFKHISDVNVAVLGPQGMGEIDNIYLALPNAYFWILVQYKGPVPDVDNLCSSNNSKNEYEQVLSTFKFIN